MPVWHSPPGVVVDRVILPSNKAVSDEQQSVQPVETTGLGTGADVAEGGHFAATDGAAECLCIKILERCTGVNANLLDPFIGVIDIAAAATFKTVGPWVALRSGFNRWFHRFGGFDRLDGLLFVAHRCVAGPIDSIDDNSRR